MLTTDRVAGAALVLLSLAVLLEDAKKRPGQISYSSSGVYGTLHMAMELLSHAAGIKLRHVLYAGAGPALTAILGGHVDALASGPAVVLPHIKAGKLRALAVTSTTRAAALPDVPTVADFVPGFEASSWFGLLAPAGTSPAIIAKINGEVAKWLATPEAREKLSAQGANIAGGTPEDFAKHIRAETAKWAKVVKDSGAKVD